MRNDVPYSEQYRLAALEWVSMDAAARMLEEGKSAFVAQRKNALGDISDAKAERAVKGSAEYSDYVKKMVSAKTAANRQKIEVEFLRMRFMENNSAEATQRAERRM